MSEKGKIKKVYKNKGVKTPLKSLVLLNEKCRQIQNGHYPGISASHGQRENRPASSQKMQKTKAELFELFKKAKPNSRLESIISGQ